MLKRYNKTPLIHEVVEHAGVLYVAGQVAEDTTADMGVQTTQALSAIGALLDAHGSNRSSMLHATIYVTDFNLKPQMNEAWPGSSETTRRAVQPSVSPTWARAS